MLWAVVSSGQIVEVCVTEPEPRDGERVMPLAEAIANGLPYA
jgi:hypothetical protein